MTTVKGVKLSGGIVETLDLPGAEPPIVLLHEGLGSVGLWRDVPQQLAEATGARVVAFSRHGHGDSDPPPRPRTPNFMHEEAREVLPELFAALEVTDPVLVGHSDGASIALIYAAEHPGCAVAVMAPHVFVEQICLDEIAGVKVIYEEQGLREKMARRHRDPDAAFYGWNSVWLHPEFPRWSIEDLLPSITCPVLAIQGVDDQYGTLAQLDKIEAGVSGPVERLHLQAQHAPQLEAPEETLSALAAFYEQVGSGGLAR
jgi:pimeloyl-ACP methyl ester carboxylesterase